MHAFPLKNLKCHLFSKKNSLLCKWIIIAPNTKDPNIKGWLRKFQQQQKILINNGKNPFQHLFFEENEVLYCCCVATRSCAISAGWSQQKTGAKSAVVEQIWRRLLRTTLRQWLRLSTWWMQMLSGPQTMHSRRVGFCVWNVGKIEKIWFDFFFCKISTGLNL